MKAMIYVMSNDCVWLEREDDFLFTPYPGLDLIGLCDEQPLRINSMSYDVNGKFYKLRLSWLSQEPMNSKQLVNLNVGWKVKVD